MLNNTLVLKYEASGDPGAVSTGSGDLGGRSYGIYQLSSTSGSVQAFLQWATAYPDAALANYAKVLSCYAINSPEFIAKWQEIAGIDPVGFAKLQNEYAGDTYYNAAVYKLQAVNYNLEKHTSAMQAVLLSRAVQYGADNMPELYTNAAKRLGYPNLSYVDTANFDDQMIPSIYDFLIGECDNAYQLSNGLYHGPGDWANGSYDVVKIGLKNRFINEKDDALALL